MLVTEFTFSVALSEDAPVVKDKSGMTELGASECTVVSLEFESLAGSLPSLTKGYRLLLRL